VAEHPTSCKGSYLKQVLSSIRQEPWWFVFGLGGIGEGLGMAWVVAYKFMITFSVQYKH